MLVIGAGAIGLAIAQELSITSPDLVIVDKENGFGKHTSSRNSEVIHAGHYYNTNSLKAKLCVEGNILLYSYLKENTIHNINTGKIIIATNNDEEHTLRKYFELGKLNGCPDFEFLDKNDVCQLEPQIKCLSGLYIPSTGIFDTHQFMNSLATKIEDQDAFIVYGMEVKAIRREHGMYFVEFSNGEVYECEYIVNSAGLWADQVASMAGLNVDSLSVRQYLCKGQYYKTTKIKGIKHLVYPVADPQGIFLGIHLTINLNGDVRFGPNAYYVEAVDYHFDEQYFQEFYTSILRYIDINPEDLIPDDTGIRPKLQGPKDGFRDFYIKEETANGYPKFVNLIGMESPGLTSSLAIAKYVAAMIIKSSKR